LNRIGRIVVVGVLLAALTPSALARVPAQESALQPQPVVVAQGAAPPQPDNPLVDTAPTIVSYQGRVTVSGVPHEGTGYFKFAVVNAAGTTSYWSNDGTSVNGGQPTANVPLSVSSGLFNVLLGDTTQAGMTSALNASVFNASDRRLRVWFATAAGGPYTQLSPDRRIGATPYALNAETLDGQDSAAFSLATHNHYGQVWTGVGGTGLTVTGAATGVSGNGTLNGLYGQSDLAAGNGVYGYASSVSGTNIGVRGQTLSSTGMGVYGQATATTGLNYGVRGVTASGSGAGVHGLASTTTGFNYGVWGETLSASGRGVYGLATATLGPNQGVYGLSASTGGYGVFGWATSTTGTTYGVYGTSDSTAGRGVYGGATATTGTNYGVYGLSTSTIGLGVYGYAVATSGFNYGVVGQSNSPNGYGVYGNASATSGTNYGVYGTSASTGGRGVHATASATSGATYGVEAVSDSTAGKGVFGWASAAGGFTYGVYGLSLSNSGRGVSGEAPAGSGTTYGVYGRSDSTAGYGVYGTSPYLGVYGNASGASGTTYGVYGQSVSTAGYGVFGRNDANVGVYGQSAAAAGAGVYGYGSTPANPGNYGIFSNGNLGVCCGAKMAIVETQDYGWRQVYSMESPDNWFEDFGQAQLVDGKATVVIEPIFAQTVNLNQPYMVFLTPVGEYCPLYVAEKTATAFTVRVESGRTCDVAFDYRIIAKRLGFEDKRLDATQDPTTMAPATPPEEAPRDVRGR
jgi:hypothetical protein